MNSKNNSRLAVFDIDGTLTDSVKVHQAAFVQALEAFGFSGYDTDWGGYLHHTDSYIFKTILEQQQSRPVTEADIDRFETLLHSHIEAATNEVAITEIRGAKAFLDTLHHRGYDVVFATGSLLAPARLKLMQAGIMPDERLVVTANRIYSRDELVLTAIRTACQFYGTSSYESVLSFGDGRWDYETARNIDIGFIGIGNPALKELGVTRFYRDFTEPGITDLHH